MQYVYVDYRKDTLEPFYVGKGVASRVKTFKRNRMYQGIVKLHGVIRDVVYESDDPNLISECEKFWIKTLKTRVELGFGGCNFTDGGDGTPGFKQTQEHKNKIGKANTGKRRSEETLQKIRNAHARQFANPESYRRFCEAQAARDPATRVALRGDASPRAIKFTIEQRQQIYDLHTSGQSIRAIAQLMNVGRWPIHRVLREM